MGFDSSGPVTCFEQETLDSLIVGKRFLDHSEVSMRNKKLCDLGRCQETWLQFLMELDVSLHGHSGMTAHS